jgi:hypothetical protein
MSDLVQSEDQRMLQQDIGSNVDQREHMLGCAELDLVSGAGAHRASFYDLLISSYS